MAKENTESTILIKRECGRCSLLSVVLLIISIALLVALVVVLALFITSKEDGRISTCESPNGGQFGHIDLTESNKPSVFRDLTSKEIKGLMAFLHSRKELNLVKASDMRVNSSYVYLSEIHLPDKQSALEHLDRNGPQPPREAHVIIFRGDKAKPDIEELLVGPLPNPTSYRKVPYRPDSIPFIYRPITGPEHVGVMKFLARTVGAILDPMFKELYGSQLIECDQKCVVFRYISPVSPAQSGEKRRKTWYWLSQFAEYFVLHPVDFAVLVDMNGPKYTIDNIWFNGKQYATLNDVLTFYNGHKQSLVKIKFPEYNTNLFSTLNTRGTPPINPPLRNPVQVSPDGKRYNIKDRQVEYMFWKFEFRMSTVRGPQVYDIRFKDERIVYELSLQEIAVFYSGFKPMQQFANYLDSLGLIGIQAKGLIPGADCPSDATFLSSSFQVESDGPFTFDNAFCLFEYNTGTPLYRHLSYPYTYGRFYGGMETTVLVLRTISTIINYDYIMDFLFYPNGAIQVKIISTGYVLATFYDSNEDKYSFKLHDNLAATIHQHLFHFKADLDIKGTSNRYATANIEIETIANKFSKAPNAKLSQHKFTTEVKRTEQDAAYKFNFETPKYLLVYNEQDKIANGQTNARSYRIINKGMSKQLLPAGKGNEPSISWARYQSAITQYKDTEQSSSSAYALLDVEEPVVRFQDFIDDNESIVDKDLVAWITMGVHHIPHTEDLPVTPTPAMDLSFYLTPYNYFKEDPSVASFNAIRIEPKEPTKLKTSIKINRYGVKKGLQCVPEDDTYDQDISEHPAKVLDTTGASFV